MQAARDALLRYCCCFVPRIALGDEPGGSLGAEPGGSLGDSLGGEPDAVALRVLAAAQRQPEDTTLTGWRAPAKVVDVHDGDTVRLVVLRDGRLQQYVCRLAGIDAPELHPRRALPDRDRVVAAARASRDRLRGLVLDTLVDAAFGRPDKYGRQLVTLRTRGAVGDVPAGTNVNDYMLRAGLAVAYDGGAKA